MAVSVVIVSWNTRQLLLDALQSFHPRSFEGEVIVVDNASSDGSVEAIRAAYPDVQVIENDRNLGFGKGCNIGFHAARFPLILLLNTDTLVLGDAIHRLISYAAENRRAGILGPMVLNEDHTQQDSRSRFPSLLNLLLQATYLYKLFPRSRWLNRARMGGSDPEMSGPVDVVSGCCFMVRKDVVKQVGVFDEDFFMYSEEVDLCYRTWNAGFEVHYVADGKIVHFLGGSSKLSSRRMFLELRRSKLRFFKKHHGRLAAETARLLLLLFLLLRLPIWALLGLASSGSSRELRQRRVKTYAQGVLYLLRPLDRILREQVEEKP